MFYIEFFQFLNTKRQHSMGSPQPIAGSEIVIAIKLFDLEDDLEFALKVVEEGESAFFTHKSSTSK